MKNEVKLFEQQKVRTHWDEKEEKWYFSIVDVISILTSQPHHQGARNYWKALKNRLHKEGNEPVTNCNRLKLVAEDGKLRFTDVADTEQLLRLIQSIPSPKAEPFKIWLARVGYERMEEIADPEQSLDRARENWIKRGRSEKCLPDCIIQAGIQQRMTGQETRNKLTDYWKKAAWKNRMSLHTLPILFTRNG